MFILVIGALYVIAAVPLVDEEYLIPYQISVPYNVTFPYNLTADYEETHLDLDLSSIETLERGEFDYWECNIPDARDVMTRANTNSSFHFYIYQKPLFEEWIESDRKTIGQPVLSRRQIDLGSDINFTTDTAAGLAGVDDYVFVIVNPRPVRTEDGLRIEMTINYADGTSEIYEPPEMGSEHLQLSEVRVVSYWSGYEIMEGVKTEYRLETRYNTSTRKITLMEMFSN